MLSDMKKIQIALLILVAGCIASCSPSEKRYDMPAVMDKSQLKFSVTQQQGHDNIVYLKSLTPGVIPYWSYDGGSSTLAADTVVFPFSGEYYIHYDVSSAGGYVTGDSVKITVTTTDLSTITDPTWKYLTNGSAGKTWVLDMRRPIGWYGFDYLKKNGSSDDWSWHPDYAGNEWVMPNRDYGQMTFDLNNAKNYQRILKDANGVGTATKSTFNLDLSNAKLKLNGAEILYGGDYYKNVSNWSEATILEISDTSLTLGVIRDKPNPGDGVCWIGFTYRVK